MSRLLRDKAFKYVPSHSTNIAKTIKRERDKIKAAQAERIIKVAALPARKVSNGR